MGCSQIIPQAKLYALRGAPPGGPGPPCMGFPGVPWRSLGFPWGPLGGLPQKPHGVPIIWPGFILTHSFLHHFFDWFVDR